MEMLLELGQQLGGLKQVREARRFAMIAACQMRGSTDTSTDNSLWILLITPSSQQYFFQQTLLFAADLPFHCSCANVPWIKSSPASPSMASHKSPTAIPGHHAHASLALG